MIRNGCCYCPDKYTCPDAFSDISRLCGAYDKNAAVPQEEELCELSEDTMDLFFLKGNVK